ncbi:MAG: hypothetical protein AUK21_03445 [Parcubacteria group bacterium CG2_30_48_51]|nr:MAG: hypothetical protein AUK21_03445 [Parcubacteria group bacterium CG2_30_48_51]
MAAYIAITDVQENKAIAPQNTSKNKNLRGNFMKSRKQLLCQLIGQKRYWSILIAKKRNKPNQWTLLSKR